LYERVVDKVDNTLNLLAKLQTRPAEETLKMSETVRTHSTAHKLVSTLVI